MLTPATRSITTPAALELLEHADVREGAGAAAREHDADRAAGEPARHALDVGVERGSGATSVGLDRIEQARPSRASAPEPGATS